MKNNIIFIYKQWEALCKKLNQEGINSVTASSLLSVDSELESFLVLKHDIENNPKKALKLAKIENKYNHKGSYYIQGNLLKKRNISILKQIKALGHEVSYHHDVMDKNKGDLKFAKVEFINYKNVFEKNGFNIITVCQHGNPLIKRNGYTSNRDFFRNSQIRNEFNNIFDIMVNFREAINSNYIYVSDTGYGWKIIFDPENNDKLDSSMNDILLSDFDSLINCLNNNNKIILSTHSHRWNKYRFSSNVRKKIFVIIKILAKKFYNIPFFKQIMHRFYYLAKKI